MGSRREREQNRRRFWHLGGRVLKTVVAVFLSLLVDSWRPDGIPFYAAITAILCIQPKAADSLEVAANREVATITGGLAGMGFLYAEHGLGLSEPDPLRYALIALMLIPLISFSVWLERPKATFLTCVVFLSVVVFHEQDVQPFAFALNRILDTTIGIIVALIVNLAPWQFRKWRHGSSDPQEDDAMDGPDS